MKFTNNKNKQPIPEKEITENMNFDKFISSYKPPVKGLFSGGAKLYALVGTVLTGIAVVVVMLAGPSVPNAAQKPFVFSPMRSMDKPLTDLVIDNSKDSTIVFSTGSLITIPAGSFEDESGTALSGKVEIHYREFHDAVDILFSGIPMNYDSAGTEYQFESAGMFEITATKDGKPVRLKSGKELKINMISRNPDPDKFNFYTLDTVGRKWDYVSENTAQNGTCIRAYEDRVAGENDRRHPQRIAEEALLNAKPVAPSMADPAKQNFRIDFDADEFPELAVFEGIKFEPVKEEKDYDPAMAKKTWEEVEVKRGKNGSQYVVTFSSGKEKHSFTVVPVVDEKDYAAAMNDFSIRQAKYEAMLSERRRTSSAANDSMYALNSHFKNLASGADLDQRFDAFISGDYKNTTRDLLVYRTFSIRRLGVHNSDLPLPFFVNESGLITGDFNAEFTVENENAMLKSVFLIRRSVNSLFSVSSQNFSRFPFNKKNIDLMVGITDENQIVYIQDADLKATKAEGKNIRFNMKKVPGEIAKAEDLKKFLNL
ncbi:MAG: hypothetical protein ACJ77K_19355 [Bacteroidia bacterium]